ncbi:uncharacterized protein BDZ99DRAFT_526266 [Mytilinidion resinicola]|uniref:Uncharacterized protein n=1 Tax=Mytilinidion resinicola TaxID=574789 RepID=A0A6A6Y6Z6_9PEZI|nr:uncharacterized protein BDZ99DRAFT_526266 [Mytilinidion resinicola]KAF2803794.1 hypothetical protein BDZ99DRAFT_526266 [Mytilinidion resinicola]
MASSGGLGRFQITGKEMGKMRGEGPNSAKGPSDELLGSLETGMRNADAAEAKEFWRFSSRCGAYNCATSQKALDLQPSAGQLLGGPGPEVADPQMSSWASQLSVMCGVVDISNGSAPPHHHLERTIDADTGVAVDMESEDAQQICSSGKGGRAMPAPSLIMAVNRFETTL